MIPSSRNNSKLPFFSWYYKEWRDGIPELGEVKKPTKSKAGQRGKREVQVSHLKCSDIPSKKISEAKEAPSVAMAEIEPRTKKMPYTLVEFWSDLEIIWNFIYEAFKEKKTELEGIVQPIMTKLYEQSGGAPPPPAEEAEDSEKDEL